MYSGVEGIKVPEKVHLGDSYNLTCSIATIDEDTTITWFRENSQLHPHSKLYYDDKVTTAKHQCYNSPCTS